MVRTAGWVYSLAEEGQVLQLVSVEIAGNVGTLTVHSHHLLAQQYLLGHDGCQATQKMALAMEQQTCPMPSSAAPWERSGASGIFLNVLYWDP